MAGAVDVAALESFRAEARAWLQRHAPRRRDDGVAWGRGSDSVAVFHNLAEGEEAELVRAAKRWQAEKYEHGYGAISWPTEYGGRGLHPAFAATFTREEARFDVPPTTEVFGVTVGLIAPTIAAHGTPQQRDHFVRPMLRTDLLACQLFSEPDAGSDLAAVRATAARDGDDWVISGQKVWTSGAHVADFGECLCRTGPPDAKHAGLTMFLVPLDAPGVDVRPIRQMTGGSAFNEVYLDAVRVPDELRLGGEGEGWSVATTTLANERGFSATEGAGTMDHSARVVATAQALGRAHDPVVRQAVADLYAHSRMLDFVSRRVEVGLQAGIAPGPEGSIGKLAWSRNLTRVAEVVSLVLGPRLVADTGEWGTFAWGEFVTGAPGYRIAGGSDEIQRNIIAERVLGLPREPRR